MKILKKKFNTLLGLPSFPKPKNRNRLTDLTLFTLWGLKKTSIFNFLENANSEVPPQTTWREIQSPNLFQKWVSAPMGGSVLCKHQYKESLKC